MKNIVKLLGLIALIALIGFSMTACPADAGGTDSPSGSPNTGPGSGAPSVTYESSDSNGVYILVITQNQNTGRAAYSPKAGDTYVLTFYPTAGAKKTTRGKVTSITSVTIVLEAASASASASATITVTINSEDKMTVLVSSTGTIKWEDNTTTTPTTLAPVIEDPGLLISDNGVLTKYNGEGGNVTIPHRVTRIGDSAFQGCTGLTSVTIPSSVTSIGEAAFAETGLTSVNIPNSVTSIERAAFANCESLISITIPNSVTSIEREAFTGCRNLTSVTIPNGVTSIGEWAFNGCQSLTSVNIPSGVTSIERAAFSFCQNLTAITVDTANTAYSSQDGVLYNKAKTTLIQYPSGKTDNTFTIPASVTSIGGNAFFFCNFTSVTIPNSVSSIGEEAFGACRSLTSVTIPASVTSIGEEAFRSTYLTSVTFATGSNITNANFGNNAFPEGYVVGGNALRTAYNAGKAGTYTRPNTTSTTWTKQP